jgi:seryl-tRNA synthetase
MPIVKIGPENYDSDLLSNAAKALLVELAELDLKIYQLKQELDESISKRKQLSKLASNAIKSAKIE